MIRKQSIAFEDEFRGDFLVIYLIERGYACD